MRINHLDKRNIAIIFVTLVVSLSISTPVALANTNNPINYDANGNRQSAFGLYFEYNNFNQLVRVRNGTASGPVVEEYEYDHRGDRTKKYEPQKSQTTYYVNKYFIQVVNSSGTFNFTYIYDGKDLIARQDPDGKKFFYHPDHLGSTSLITNETGNVAEETTYEPFGKVASGGSDRFQYTGKELDTGTGLEYYGARYYDPSKASQFISPDSVIADVYDPQALNRYSYVLNNPYRYTDPDGNIAVSFQGSGGFAGGIPIPYLPYNIQLGAGTQRGSGLVLSYGLLEGFQLGGVQSESYGKNVGGGGADIGLYANIDLFSNTVMETGGESESYEISGFTPEGGLSIGLVFPKKDGKIDYFKPALSIRAGVGLEASYQNLNTKNVVTPIYQSSNQPNNPRNVQTSDVTKTSSSGGSLGMSSGQSSLHPYFTGGKTNAQPQGTQTSNQKYSEPKCYCLIG